MIVQKLNKIGIGTQVHYIPVYRHPYYENLQVNGYAPENFPKAESYYRQALTIPLYPAMTAEYVERVIEGVLKVCT